MNKIAGPPLRSFSKDFKGSLTLLFSSDSIPKRSSVLTMLGADIAEPFEYPPGNSADTLRTNDSLLRLFVTVSTTIRMQAGPQESVFSCFKGTVSPYAR